MNTLAKTMAVLGGIVLSLLIILVCLSVIGRSLNGFFHGPFATLLPGFSQWALNAGVGPINGDFELVEAGIAFAIFAFLPLCQLTGGHASVDIFTARLPAGLYRLLRAVIEVVFALVLIMIAVQLFEGMSTKLRNGQTTFLLQFPVWWAYAASLVGAIATAVVATYVAAVRVLEFFTSRSVLTDDGETGH